MKKAKTWTIGTPGSKKQSELRPRLRYKPPPIGTLTNNATKATDRYIPLWPRPSPTQ